MNVLYCQPNGCGEWELSHTAALRDEDSGIAQSADGDRSLTVSMVTVRDISQALVSLLRTHSRDAGLDRFVVDGQEVGPVGYPNLFSACASDDEAGFVEVAG